MVAASATFGAVDLDDTGQNLREDLSDIITNISPTETPFQANIGKADASQPFHEWLKDDFQTAGTNAHVEGDDFGTNVTNDQTTGADRLGNYLQISKKQIKIGRRANISTKAGRTSEISYQLAKKGYELRRDIEHDLLDNVAANAEAGSTAARSAGLPAWLRTNDSGGSTGTSPTLSSSTFGFPNAARGAGTGRALSEGTLLTTLKDIYNAGGQTNMIMMSPAIKQRWSGYLMGQGASGASNPRSATQYQDQQRDPGMGVTVVGAVGVYISDFGKIDVVPNRFQNATDVFLLDTKLFDIAYLDGYKTEELAKIGDSERYHILADWCLESKDEAGSGGIFDINDAAVVV